MTFMWGRFLATSAVIMTVGYGFLTYATPTEEEFYNQLSPELKRKVDEVRRQRAEMSMPTVKDKLQTAGDQEKVIWADDLKKK